MSNVITPNLSLYEQLKNLHASMLKNGQAAVTSGHTADPDEGIHLKDIKLEKHELLLFKNVPDNDTDLGHYDMIEKSKLQTNLLNVLKKIFADAYGVDLVYYPTYNKWVFQVMFYFMSDEQFKQVCEDSGLEPGKDIFRALDSKINTLENAGNSVGQTLLAITNSQVQSTMDASKYASFSTAAKEYLSNMIFTNGDKKPRWINEHNYKLATVSNTGYNGQRFNNLVGIVVLDAEEVLARFCATIENRNKYRFVLDNPKDKMNGYDTLFTVKMVNKKRKAVLQNECGVRFVD
ncbi:MAG: hypothetical protein VZR64_00020 [Eubacterium sp.]|nr:hypothetical protein [Eubacterium sp.]